MSDPIDVATQTTQTIADNGSASHAIWAVLGGVVVKVVEALAKLIGTRKERAEAEAAEAAPNERAADLAIRIAEEEREETARTRHRAETCEERLAVMDTRMRDLERRVSHHETVCVPRIAHLEREQELARTMLADVMRHASTPSSGLYTPEDVRAALRAEET